MSVIRVLARLRQEDHAFKASVNKLAGTLLQQNKTKQTLNCVLKILELWFIEAILDGPQMSDR